MSQSLARWRSLRSFELKDLAPRLGPFAPASASFLASGRPSLGETPRPPAAAPGVEPSREIDLIVPTSRPFGAQEVASC